MTEPNNIKHTTSLQYEQYVKYILIQPVTSQVHNTSLPLQKLYTGLIQACLTGLLELSFQYGYRPVGITKLCPKPVVNTYKINTKHYKPVSVMNRKVSPVQLCLQACNITGIKHVRSGRPVENGSGLIQACSISIPQ